MNWLRRALGLGKSTKKAHPFAGMSFTSNDAFFEYQCQFGNNEIRRGKICFGIIVDDCTEIAAKIFNEPIEDDLTRVFQVELASKNRNLYTYLPHDLRKGIVSVGDLVAWLPVERLAAGWSGALVALCAPEFKDEGIKVITYF